MASNEATLERMLQKVIDLWMATDFRLVPHASGAVSIIAGADDILAQLEESQVTIGTIRGSRYVTPIKVLHFESLYVQRSQRPGRCSCIYNSKKF